MGFEKFEVGYSSDNSRPRGRPRKSRQAPNGELPLFTDDRPLDTFALSKWLWETAYVANGPVDAPKYNDYILPLIRLTAELKVVEHQGIADYMLISSQFMRQFSEMMRGGHYPTLNDWHVRDMTIPDCPPERQWNIGEKLDSSFQSIVSLRSSLESQITQLLNNVAPFFPALITEAHGFEKI